MQGVLRIAGRNRLSGNTNDVVEIEIEMLKVEEVVDDEESSSNNGPDDNDDDDGTYGSPVRRSPRNRTMSTKARETVVSSEVKEKVSDKYLRFDAARLARFSTFSLFDIAVIVYRLCSALLA